MKKSLFYISVVFLVAVAFGEEKSSSLKNKTQTSPICQKKEKNVSSKTSSNSVKKNKARTCPVCKKNISSKSRARTSPVCQKEKNVSSKTRSNSVKRNKTRTCPICKKNISSKSKTRTSLICQKGKNVSSKTRSNSAKKNKKRTCFVCQKKAKDYSRRSRRKCCAYSFTKKNEVLCAKNLYINADYLYMTFYENVEYAYINSYFPNESVYDFHSGLRLGLSFLSFNTFYLNARWTYLHFKNKSEVTSDSENIMGSLLPPDDLNVMAGASSRFKGDLNTLDINLIRSYCVSRRYVASPRLGLRAAWIDQHCLTNYSISNLENTVKYKNDFWGIGLCASYEGLFKAHKYISFYSDNLFSLLYGRFKTSQYSTSSFSYLQYFVREKYYSLSPNVEMSLGLILHNYFNHNKCKWSLKLGYEFQYWWNQNKLKKFLDVDPIAVRNFTRTYLLFHGLVVSFMLNF